MKRSFAWTFAICGIAIATALFTIVLSIASHLTATAEQSAGIAQYGQPITIEANRFSLDPRQPKRKKFGKLLWQSGIVLSSSFRNFGGFSGLEINKNGTHLIAVTDRGAWLTANVTYKGRQLDGLKNARFGQLLGPKGTPLIDKVNTDAEGLVAFSRKGEGGTLLVSFERRHRIRKYAFTKHGVARQIGAIGLPRATKQLNWNRGLEGLAVIRKGRLNGTIVAIAERRVDKSGALTGWLVGGPTPGIIRIKRLNGFDVTDLTTLPDGDLLLLERRFRKSADIRMRIRKIAKKDLRRGAGPIVGEILFEGNWALTIDNMEGIAAHVGPSGETVITVISDDNFNFFQRTIMMQFVLPNRTANVTVEKKS
ncbi:MAG: esterase-like activity of phytase family protein [Methyloligellaceae bacterium]